MGSTTHYIYPGPIVDNIALEPSVEKLADNFGNPTPITLFFVSHKEGSLNLHLITIKNLLNGTALRLSLKKPNTAKTNIYLVFLLL